MAPRSLSSPHRAGREKKKKERRAKWSAGVVGAVSCDRANGGLLLLFCLGHGRCGCDGGSAAASALAALQKRSLQLAALVAIALPCEWFALRHIWRFVPSASLGDILCNQSLALLS